MPRRSPSMVAARFSTTTDDQQTVQGGPHEDDICNLDGSCRGTFAAGLAWTGAAGADDIKIGYINKMGDHPWFVAEVGGAKKTAEEAGADLRVAGRAVRRQSDHHHLRHDGRRRRQGHRHRGSRQGARAGGRAEGQGRGHSADRRRRRHLLRGRHAGPLCRHRTPTTSASRSARRSPRSTSRKAGPARKCASPRSRTARPTPACSATRAPRKRSSRRFRTSSRRTSSASPTTTRWSTRST